MSTKVHISTVWIVPPSVIVAVNHKPCALRRRASKRHEARASRDECTTPPWQLGYGTHVFLLLSLLKALIKLLARLATRTRSHRMTDRTSTAGGNQTMAMAMATPEFSRILAFERSSISWKSWYGRLQFFFEAYDVQGVSKKYAHLLTLCGLETYNTVGAFVQPQQPSQVTFDEIVQLLKASFDPTPSEVYRTSRFQRRDQEVGGTVSAYGTALRKLAADCDFRSSAEQATNPTVLRLDVILRDRFVCCLRSEKVQQRLFAEKELTFIEAYEFAIRAERAVQQQQKIKSDH